MTLRERGELVIVQAQSVETLDQAVMLWTEAHEVYRRLRGGHNSVGHRSSVKNLRRRLLVVTYQLRQWGKQQKLFEPTVWGPNSHR